MMKKNKKKKKQDENAPAEQELSEAELEDVAGGYELQNTLISSYSVSGAGDDGAIPTEQISLNYAKIPRRR